MNPEDIGTKRLASQRIIQADFNKPEEAVHHMLAMQAQDYGSGLWSVGLRTKGNNLADIEKALAERKIIRTWPMRGTIHLVHAQDVHWLLALLAPRATAAAKSRRLGLGLTDEVMAEAEAVLRDALSGGKYLQRKELVGILAERVTKLPIGNSQASHIFRNLGERGIICFGPHIGKQPTFTLLDEWAPRARMLSRNEALAELAARYFKSHGPATLADFIGWGFMTANDARRAIELASSTLRRFEANERVYYQAVEAAKETNISNGFLLPGFDEYILGYKERSDVLPPEYSQQIVPGGNGMFLPTIVLDGKVVGTWKRTTTKADTKVALEMFTPLTNKQQERIEPAIQKLRGFYRPSANI